MLAIAELVACGEDRALLRRAIGPSSAATFARLHADRLPGAKGRMPGAAFDGDIHSLGGVYGDDGSKLTGR